MLVLCLLAQISLPFPKSLSSSSPPPHLLGLSSLLTPTLLLIARSLQTKSNRLKSISPVLTSLMLYENSLQYLDLRQPLSHIKHQIHRLPLLYIFPAETLGSSYPTIGFLAPRYTPLVP